ncbi:winged helix-turn-helix domain-containing protein [Streptomyces jumonjinensis]|uniref:winged helix-turn-helix domain-containing protein n=1 Tax=Streptomyces jumonjinensis TaxID=1945 RepID=UPI00379B98B9
MANSLPFSAVSTVSAVPGGSAAARPAAGVSTARRLRAVERDEVVPPVRLAQVAELLPPGATWLPAPQHTVPSLPGRPPMVGYLVLVPADQHPPAAAPAPQPAAPAAVGGTGPVRIDQAERIAVVNGRALDLTYLEFELLTHLVTHPHRVHTRDQLVTTVWGYGHVGDGRTVDVHVARLRRKLGAEHRHTIQTVRRVGYKYTP